LDICANTDGNLVIGTESGMNYVAQLDIPAREYIYPEPDAGEGMGEMDGTEAEPPTPVSLDMKKVMLTLWAIGK
jgi:hypothetical protein